MKSDIEIAQEAKLIRIDELAHSAGLSDDEFEPYGRDKAKVSFHKDRQPHGKLILVTATSGMPAGSGKTTTSIALTQGLKRLGEKAVVALREPSLGPCFGMKGGAAGGGYSQVLPMESINLHFTGDFHAITAANNLLAAMIDNARHQGQVDLKTVIWRRVLDVNDRMLRNIVTGLGGPANGIPTETGFDITVASELMAVLCLANLDENDSFSSQLVHQLLHSREAQDRLIAALVEEAEHKGYHGADVDFECVYGEDGENYAAFLSRLREALSPKGLPLSAALAAKTSDNQPGRLYEGHNYALIAQAVDYALLMTYDWGYISGPPMAVAPLPQVRQVLEYALTHFSPGQLYLGIPNYGYNWPIPFREGNRAVSLGNQQAVSLAWDRRAAIRYDETAQAPWFRYVDESGKEREVWFEDARSIASKLDLVTEYGFAGALYWNFDRPNSQNLSLLIFNASEPDVPCRPCTDAAPQG